MNMPNLRQRPPSVFEAQVWAKRPPASGLGCAKARTPRPPTRAEADETYFSGKQANMSNARRRPLKGAGCGTVGKRAAGKTGRRIRFGRRRRGCFTSAGLQGFVILSTRLRATGCTDEAAAYAGFAHEEINHSEYVCGTVHPNGVESFWPMLKRAYRGTFHKISPRHLNQCIQEFSSASSGLRQADTLAQMTVLAVGTALSSLITDCLSGSGGMSGVHASRARRPRSLMRAAIRLGIFPVSA
ncbi:MAG: hypothetical protein M2R46_00248 [Verrucomicrobia subdivision 3 bacterium]|nr:hypothetical protein [Limisphaerales bacterium]